MEPFLSASQGVSDRQGSPAKCVHIQAAWIFLKSFRGFGVCAVPEPSGCVSVTLYFLLWEDTQTEPSATPAGPLGDCWLTTMVKPFFSPTLTILKHDVASPTELCRALSHLPRRAQQCRLSELLS